MTTFTEPPLSYMNDPNEFFRWHREVGPAVAKEQLTEAVRGHMQEHGTRSVLDVVERMDDLIALAEEHGT